jgi:hypothetical protein
MDEDFVYISNPEQGKEQLAVCSINHQTFPKFGSKNISSKLNNTLLEI